jgi:acyl-CoA thioesterase FadM
VAVFVDTRERRPVEVPGAFRDAVARFEGQEVEA